MTDEDVIRNFQKAVVECEHPNEMLYKFEGNLKFNGSIIPLSVDQILLRGSSLRNTDYIYGVVVFTGHETKIMKNSVKSRSKFSKLERSTNTYIIIIIFFQIIVSLIAAFANTIWEIVYYEDFPYLRLNEEDRQSFMLTLVI
jgi:magnesium-transporting ATPase (P-type)